MAPSTVTDDDSRRDEAVTRALDRAAAYGRRFRRDRRALHPSANVSELRRLFDVALPNEPRDAVAVLDDLIRAAAYGRKQSAINGR